MSPQCETVWFPERFLPAGAGGDPRRCRDRAAAWRMADALDGRRMRMHVTCKSLLPNKTYLC